MAFMHPFMSFPPQSTIEPVEPKPLELIPAEGDTVKLRVCKELHRVRFSDEDEKFVTLNVEPKS